MDQQALQTFIQNARAKGMSETDITNRLINAGWNTEVVHTAINGSTTDDLVPPPPASSGAIQPQIGSTTMWDAFEHILLFISLYTLATAIALLLHYYVDHYFPGVTPNSVYVDDSWYLTFVRGYLAAIIVSLPLYLFLFLHITKRTLHYPNIRNNRSRKILIYLTLVVTFIIMLWNIGDIVFSFLNGNVTLNFILHFLVTIFINGIIFTYYFYQIKEDKKIHA